MLLVLDYYDSVWNCCNKSNMECLERLQRRADRIVMRSDTDTALINLKWTTLANRRNQHVVDLVLHVPKVKTEADKKAFYYNGCFFY